MTRTPKSLAVVAVALLAVTGAAPAAAADGGYRAGYHFTVPDHWKNDPQRPIYVNGKLHYYYLYNGDYDANPSANYGTAWRLATSDDGVTFTDQGVAAQKNTNANYDLWSGSTVVDTGNTAGFGAGAVVMLVTQMDHPTAAQKGNGSGPQAQFLWYSTDGGRHFTPYGESPVIANGGRADFRDPKVVWDAGRNRWVAVIAEGQRIGFYTSANLRSWTRVSEYQRTDLGTLECPDLFRMRATDGSTHWVLGMSANGSASGAPSTYAYWTGDFNGTSFSADSTTPQWLDHGFDWYGAVTWEDPATPLDKRYAIGWMNNWAYPHTTPTWANDGFNGTDSIVRELSLRHYGSTYSLASQPAAALGNHATGRTELGTITVNGTVPLGYHGVAYQLETTVDWTTAQNIGLQLRRSADGSRHADTGVYGGFSYLNRGGTTNPDSSGSRRESRAPFDMNAHTVHLRILVDRTSVEVFVDDGRRVHSSQVFPTPADDGIALYADGGGATFSNVTITEFGGRPARVLADFEGPTWGSGWVATGSFASAGPSNSSLPGQVGARVADTYAGGGDPATGIITSPGFVIDRNHLRFRIAGGDHALGVEPATSVQLLINGQPVRTATGDNSATMRAVDWDVSAYAGQTAKFQILDDATGGWGHLMVDQVVLSD
jgi:levanbiose-producing levanase